MLPTEFQPLDFIVNHLPRAEIGLSLGKWKKAWPALINVLREIDRLSHPDDDFDEDEPTRGHTSFFASPPLSYSIRYLVYHYSPINIP